MIPNNKYVPILKGKSGEFRALNNLPSEIKDAIVPIIDLVKFTPQSSKYTQGKRQQTFDDYVNAIIKYFRIRWEYNRLIYIDGYLLNKNKKLSNGYSPLKFIFDTLLNENYLAIPVFHIEQSDNRKNEIKVLSKKINKGIALRVPFNNGSGLDKVIKEAINFLEIYPTKIDLIIDLQDLSSVDIKKYETLVSNEINQLENLGNYRSLVLAGGTFPRDLQKIPADSLRTIPRNMWNCWRNIVDTKELKRLPSYADYCISHRLMAETNGAPPNPSASIRYTHENKFYIYRGRGLKEYKHSQYYEEAEALLNSKHFYGRHHCVGDEFIFKCGTEKKKPGSPEKWRWVGTAHHITVVVNQLRQFFRDLSA